jgi:3-deoxy-D-manno-octulosonic-acid transferase
LRLIENTAHRDCLRLKRESHILFDHLQGYFGVSSLEGLSQGLCVIAGLDDWNVKHIKSFTQTAQLPWVVVNTTELAEKLKQLINDTDWIKETGRQSRKFMSDYWNPPKVLDRLVEQIQ